MMSQRVEKADYESVDRSRFETHLTDDLLARYNTTPDWLQIKQLENIPVFVYGTLMSGGRNHFHLGGSRPLGRGRTCTQGFLMEATDWDFPVVFKHNASLPGARAITGEIYFCEPEHILAIDRLEGNGEIYQREMIHVWASDQEFGSKKVHPSVRCWMYLGVPNYWEDQPSRPMTKEMITINDRTFQGYRWKNTVPFKDLDKKWNRSHDIQSTDDRWSNWPPAPKLI